MICSLTAYNRPDLLEQVVDSFLVAAAALDEQTFLVARVEPSPELDEVMEILELRSTRKGLRMVVVDAEANEHRLGLQANTLAALEGAWQLVDSGVDHTEFVLHLEDDLLIAPDGLRLAAWMRDTYRGRGDELPFMSLTNVHSQPTPADYRRVTRTGWFECHVWGCWRQGWDELHEAWPHHWYDHWAAIVNDEVLAGRSQLLPVLSRSRSIGVYGEHCNPEFHERHNPHVYAGDVALWEDYFE